MTSKNVNNFLYKKYENNETFHGHKFSEFQTGYHIMIAQRTGTADGGIRCLDIEEWAQVEKVFKAKPELRKAALEICGNCKNATVHSTNYDDKPYLKDLSTTSWDYFVSSKASLLVGRSDPQTKVGYPDSWKYFTTLP